MQYSFLRSPLPGIFFAALFFMSSAVLAQQKPEASHRERFAPKEQTMQKAEQDLDAKLAAHPDDPHLASERGLERLETMATTAGLTST